MLSSECNPMIFQNTSFQGFRNRLCIPCFDSPYANAPYYKFKTFSCVMSMLLF
ncbi:hypothetical protein L3Y34_010953 [Caenorhabditis briggsae]|uniref:Uncharacterized protein n=1 Tax=Caenorhabditis briggsae TaxID=6238 RepID=A0AAE8ZMR8_CAEBR|nr:hypothetical protein L3Y34_010953 [Caenorhabditis briggsae]